MVAFVASSMLQVMTAAPVSAEAKPVLYLTFDDGPGPDTPRFLDLLAGYDIEATFFVTGKAVDANPSVARRIVADGHAIANHTWNHPRLTSLSSAAILSEFRRTNDVIASVTGEIATCHRPPYGATNGRVYAQAVAAGVGNEEWTTGSRASHLGLWDIDTNDWRLSLGGSGWSEAAMLRELNKARDGDTVLMHDGSARRPRGLAVLTSWLAANHDRFEFRTLPGCGGHLTEPGIDDANPQHWHRFQIARLYRAYFDRAPDDAGWEYWNKVASRGVGLIDISYSFAQSAEFSLDGPRDDLEFATFVYAEVLDREPDPDGLVYWLDELDRGLDRGEMIIYFSESEEYISATVAAITGACLAPTVEDSYRCLAAILPTYAW